MRSAWLWWGLLGLGLLGCAGSRAPHPSDALARYCQAVERRDADAVYQLLDEPMRMGMDQEGFRAWFARNHESLQEQARKLAAKTREQDMVVEAAVPVVVDREVLLVWEDGRWFLSRELLGRGAQRSPKETIEALQRALHDQDLEELMRLMSAQKRAEYLRELEILGHNLEGALDNAIIAQGDHADLMLDNGDRLRLVREDGVWRIVAYEQAQR